MKQVRRQGALARLQAQLQSGVKTAKGSRDKKIPLTDQDVKRIEKEIGILQKSLK